MYTNFTTDEAVGMLILDRSPANSMNIEFLTELNEILHRIDKIDHIKVIILSSAYSRIFSSGLDLRSLSGDDSRKTAANIFRAVELVYKIVTRILQSDKVFISAISGAAIGSAVSIALSCDFCIGTSNAWFWLPDPQYGGLLADGGLDIVTHAVGASRARMMLLTNDRVDACKARDWGLIYKLVDAGQLDNAALYEAKRICSYSGDTLRYTKKLVNRHLQDKFHKYALMKVLQGNEVHMRLKRLLENWGKRNVTH